MKPVPAQIWQQIALGTKMRIGIHARTLLYSDTMLQFDAGTPKRRFVIELNGRDLYDITYGRMTRSLQWVELDRRADVSAETLNSTLQIMAGELT